jgi:mono/diheme cytochrome c family protein
MSPRRSAGAVLVSAALALVAARPGPEDRAEGRVLYARYCAACHGLAADGHGPVAPVLAPPPTDLRRLGDRYGRPRDLDRVARFVDGRDVVTAHGPRTMPVWGERFATPEPEPEASGPPAIDARIGKIVAYLATLQDAGR